MPATISCLLVVPLVLGSVPLEPPAVPPGNAPILLDLAGTHLTIGEKAEALALVDEALLLDQESGWARALRLAVDVGLWSGTPAGDRAVAVRLVERSVTVEYEHAELGGIFDDLERRLGVDIFADWPALETIGIRHDDRITLKTDEMTAAELLEDLVKLVGDQARPRWRINQRRVTVSAPKALRDRTRTVVYDVRDLARADDKAARLKAVNRLIDQLRADIDPEGWHSRGGDRNRLLELRGNLIITSTPWNQRAIEATLIELRVKRARRKLR